MHQLDISILAGVLALGGCVVGSGDSPAPTHELLAAGATGITGRGLNVDPANQLSRPCVSLADSLHVSGFIRMPVKFTSTDWTWRNGGFEGYLTCLRATLPGITIVGTIGEATVDPAAGVPSNPYYSHVCNPAAELASCPEFETWLDAYLTHVSPTIMKHFDVIEVFNEPDDMWNGSTFAPPQGGHTHSSMPPAAYAELLNAFYDKFSGPLGRLIVMGGMDSGQVNYLAAMAPYRSDMVNIHPYGGYPENTPQFKFDPAHHTCSSSFGTLDPCFGTFENAIDKYRTADRAAGNSGTVLISEWGTGNTAAQPGLIRAFFYDPVTTHANAAMFAYSDANAPGFGVVTTTGEHKPSFDSFAAQ